MTSERQWRTDVALPLRNSADEPKDKDAKAIQALEAHWAEQRAGRAEREASTARLRELCGVAPPPPKHWTWGEKMLGRKIRAPRTFAERLAEQQKGERRGR